MPADKASSIIAPSPTPLLTFRPDIEGLRAVAVALVVVLHFGVAAVSGGFVGVDVFFVISGFLITSLLLDEVRATGRVSILAFYARRARRILPAACFVIAVTVAVAYLQLGPLIGRSTAIDGQWAAGFAANFRFIGQGTNYFARNLPPSSMQHYWSLAVEEQFYLVWPTVLFGLVLLGRRFARSALTLQVGLGVIVAASLYWSIHLSEINPTGAYFSPFTRAWELGAGALVAVFTTTIRQVAAPLRAAATWAGLAMVAITAFTFTATTVFPGYSALLPVGGTALMIAGGMGAPAGGAGRVLGLAPLRALGKISFSVYLWHWPVLVIAEERSSTPLSNVARLVCVAITLALSIATFYLIEHPMRSSSLFRARSPRNIWEGSRKALAVGAIAIVAAGGVSVYINNRAASAIDRSSAAAGIHKDRLASSLTPAPSSSAEAQVTAMQQQLVGLLREGNALTKVPGDVEPSVLQLRLDSRYSACLQARRDVVVKTCTFGSTKSARTLVVFGDSHGTEWMPALDTYGQRAGYRVVTATKEACPVPDLDIFTGQAAGQAQASVVIGAYPECTTWRSNVLSYIRSIRPAAVVIAFGRENTSANGFDQASWLSGLNKSLSALRASSPNVVEIGSNSLLTQDPGLCLSRSNADPSACPAKFPPRDLVDAEQRAVRASRSSFVDVEPWLCVDGRCPVIIDNRIAYADFNHLSPQYVDDLEPLVDATLRAAGLR